MHITEKVRHLCAVSKEYYITGRANLIFCAVGLRQIHGYSTALPQKIPFILDRNSLKANCTGNQVCTSCDIVVLGCYPSIFISL